MVPLEKKFGKYGERPWTGHSNIRELVTDIEKYWPEDEHQLLWNFLRVVHRDNNQLLHATVSGLASAGNRMDGEGIYLSIGPSPARIEKGLFAAYWPFANHLDLLVKRFELPVQGELDEMVGRQQYEFRRLTSDEVKDVGRNDLCPCGSGKKFKKCHKGRPLANAGAI
jgi:SEC-C motif